MVSKPVAREHTPGGSYRVGPSQSVVTLIRLCAFRSVSRHSFSLHYGTWPLPNFAHIEQERWRLPRFARVSLG